ncbi:3'-5' exonuclease [Aeromonas veronii]|nr:3'-5' exonuclease [Aeromonas veronii]
MHHCLTYFSPLAKLSRARSQYLTHHPDLPIILKQLLTAPLPEADWPLARLPLLALDFETTGLDPAQDHILSIATVAIDGGGIELSSARHNYVNGPYVVKAETAVINQLLPVLLAAGRPLDEVMDALFNRMAGHILLAHGSTVERRFIDAYIQARFGLPPLPLAWLDTLTIEKRRHRHQRAITSDFRLASLRKQAHLPDYPAHDALLDAIATAELLLAYSTHLISSRPVSFKELIRLQGNQITFTT